MAVRRQSNVRSGTPALFGRAAIHARISLDRVGEAAGVGRQIDACGHLAEVEGWRVDEVLVDNDLSAYSGACRPEYERLLDLVRRCRDPHSGCGSRRPQHGERPVHAQVLGAAADHESAPLRLRRAAGVAKLEIYRRVLKVGGIKIDRHRPPQPHLKSQR
jgi:hypothetical protein